MCGQPSVRKKNLSHYGYLPCPGDIAHCALLCGRRLITQVHRSSKRPMLLYSKKKRVIRVPTTVSFSPALSLFFLFVCLFSLVGFLTSSSTTRLYRGRAPRQERLTILRAATHETELNDHDFCLSRSHYTDTDPTSRERAATAGIEPGTSSPGVARSTN